jgi:hypothetical protein
MLWDIETIIREADTSFCNSIPRVDLKVGFLHFVVCLICLLNVINKIILIRCLIFMHEAKTKFYFRFHKIIIS